MSNVELHELDATHLICNQNDNAQAWAKSFNYHLAIRGEQPLDEGLMIGWFAIAIETAKDKLKNQLDKKEE